MAKGHLILQGVPCPFPASRSGEAGGCPLNRAVGLVTAGPVGRRGNRPFSISWEASDSAEHDALRGVLAFPTSCPVSDALAALEPHCHVPGAKAARDWLTQQRRVVGLDEVTAEQLYSQIGRALAASRRYINPAQSNFVAMNIQQAKNHEFDDVIAIWPYTLPNDGE